MNLLKKILLSTKSNYKRNRINLNSEIHHESPGQDSQKFESRLEVIEYACLDYYAIPFYLQSRNLAANDITP